MPMKLKKKRMPHGPKHPRRQNLKCKEKNFALLGKQVQEMLEKLQILAVRHLKYNMFLEMIEYHIKIGVIPPGLQLDLKPLGFNGNESSLLLREWKDELSSCSKSLMNILKYHYSNEVTNLNWLKNSLKRQVISAIMTEENCSSANAKKFVENWIEKSVQSGLNNLTDVFYDRDTEARKKSLCRRQIEDNTLPICGKAIDCPVFDDILLSSECPIKSPLCGKNLDFTKSSHALSSPPLYRNFYNEDYCWCRDDDQYRYNLESKQSCSQIAALLPGNSVKDQCVLRVPCQNEQCRKILKIDVSTSTCPCEEFIDKNYNYLAPNKNRNTYTLFVKDNATQTIESAENKFPNMNLTINVPMNIELDKTGESESSTKRVKFPRTRQKPNAAKQASLSEIDQVDRSQVQNHFVFNNGPSPVKSIKDRKSPRWEESEDDLSEKINGEFENIMNNENNHQLDEPTGSTSWNNQSPKSNQFSQPRLETRQHPLYKLMTAETKKPKTRLSSLEARELQKQILALQNYIDDKSNNRPDFVSPEERNNMGTDDYTSEPLQYVPAVHGPGNVLYINLPKTTNPPQKKEHHNNSGPNSNRENITFRKNDNRTIPLDEPKEHMKAFDPGVRIYEKICDCERSSPVHKIYVIDRNQPEMSALEKENISSPSFADSSETDKISSKPSLVYDNQDLNKHRKENDLISRKMKRDSSAEKMSEDKNYPYRDKNLKEMSLESNHQDPDKHKYESKPRAHIADKSKSKKTKYNDDAKLKLKKQFENEQNFPKTLQTSNNNEKISKKSLENRKKFSSDSGYSEESNRFRDSSNLDFETEKKPAELSDYEETSFESNSESSPEEIKAKKSWKSEKIPSSRNESIRTIEPEKRQSGNFKHPSIEHPASAQYKKSLDLITDSSKSLSDTFKSKTSDFEILKTRSSKNDITSKRGLQATRNESKPQSQTSFKSKNLQKSSDSIFGSSSTIAEPEYRVQSKTSFKNKIEVDSNRNSQPMSADVQLPAKTFNVKQKKIDDDLMKKSSDSLFGSSIKSLDSDNNMRRSKPFESQSNQVTKEERKQSFTFDKKTPKKLSDSVFKGSQKKFDFDDVESMTSLDDEMESDFIRKMKQPLNMNTKPQPTKSISSNKKELENSLKRKSSDSIFGDSIKRKDSGILKSRSSSQKSIWEIESISKRNLSLEKERSKSSFISNLSGSQTSSKQSIRLNLSQSHIEFTLNNADKGIAVSSTKTPENKIDSGLNEPSRQLRSKTSSRKSIGLHEKIQKKESTDSDFSDSGFTAASDKSLKDAEENGFIKKTQQPLSQETKLYTSQKFDLSKEQPSKTTTTTTTTRSSLVSQKSHKSSESLKSQEQNRKSKSTVSSRKTSLESASITESLEATNEDESEIVDTKAKPKENLVKKDIFEKESVDTFSVSNGSILTEISSQKSSDASLKDIEKEKSLTLKKSSKQFDKNGKKSSRDSLRKKSFQSMLNASSNKPTSDHALKKATTADSGKKRKKSESSSNKSFENTQSSISEEISVPSSESLPNLQDETEVSDGSVKKLDLTKTKLQPIKKSVETNLSSIKKEIIPESSKEKDSKKPVKTIDLSITSKKLSFSDDESITTELEEVPDTKESGVLLNLNPGSTVKNEPSADLANLTVEPSYIGSISSQQVKPSRPENIFSQQKIVNKDQVKDSKKRNLPDIFKSSSLGESDSDESDVEDNPPKPSARLESVKSEKPSTKFDEMLDALLDDDNTAGNKKVSSFIEKETSGNLKTTDSNDKKAALEPIKIVGSNEPSFPKINAVRLTPVQNKLSMDLSKDGEKPTEDQAMKSKTVSFLNKSNLNNDQESIKDENEETLLSDKKENGVQFTRKFKSFSDVNTDDALDKLMAHSRPFASMNKLQPKLTNLNDKLSTQFKTSDDKKEIKKHDVPDIFKKSSIDDSDSDDSDQSDKFTAKPIKSGSRQKADVAASSKFDDMLDALLNDQKNDKDEAKTSSQKKVFESDKKLDASLKSQQSLQPIQSPTRQESRTLGGSSFELDDDLYNFDDVTKDQKDSLLEKQKSPRPFTIFSQKQKSALPSLTESESRASITNSSTQEVGSDSVEKLKFDKTPKGKNNSLSDVLDKKDTTSQIQNIKPTDANKSNQKGSVQSIIQSAASVNDTNKIKKMKSKESLLNVSVSTASDIDQEIEVASNATSEGSF